MYCILNPRERSLHTGTNVYNTPWLLAGALGKLARLAEEYKNTTAITRAGPDCIVDLLDLTDNTLTRVELVMPNEAAPKQGKISVLSPLGSSLLKLKAGDISRVDLWGRKYKFKILGIHHTNQAIVRKEEMPS